jgi:hypothetical protein
MNYARFFAMIATSTVVMFGLMYLNTYLLSHVFWSETRAYMAVLMGATMAMVMLAFMLSMYTNRTANIAIFAGAAIVFALSLWLVRSQATIGDRAYMSAMIPHHSIAIMTSSRANISDPRVRKLADEIVFAQDKEIAEMRWLISDIASGDGQEEQPGEPAEIVSLDEALSTAEIAVLDLEFLTEEEVATLFPQGASCVFTYTENSRPVLAVGEGGFGALVKISGDLVQLSPDGGSGAAFATDGLSIQVGGPQGDALSSAAGQRDADLLLNLERGLRAGYRGYYDCRA